MDVIPVLLSSISAFAHIFELKLYANTTKSAHVSRLNYYTRAALALPPIPSATLTETVTPGPKQMRDPIVAASAAASRFSSQAAVSTKPARTSATTSPGWRLASSSVAARRTNPSQAPVCQSPGIASTRTPSSGASSKDSSPSKRRNSLSSPPGSLLVESSRLESRGSKA